MIFAECFKKSQKAIFQYLKVEDGRPPEWLEAGEIVRRGDKWMLNIGEFPNVEKESTLYTILEETVPEKYYLSARACSGIIKRAEKRHRILPEIMKEALMQQI